MSGTSPASSAKGKKTGQAAAVALAFLAVSGIAQAVSRPTLVWTRTYNAAADDDDLVYGVAIDASGNIAAAGSEIANASHYEDWLVRMYGVNGAVLWNDHYNGPGNDTDEALAVAVNASGDVIAGGYEASAGMIQGKDALVRCLDPGGNLLWSANYNDPADGDDLVQGVAVDGSGNIIVAGDSDTGALLMKFDSTGACLWSTVFQGSFGEGDSFNAVACDSAGNIIVAGFVDYGLPGMDWLVCKYTPGGALMWALTVPEGNNEDDLAKAVAVDGAGNSFIAGYTSRAKATQEMDWAVRKISPAGNLLWQRFYDGPSHLTDNANGVAVDSGGGAVVAGDSEGSLMLRKYTPDGDLAWVAGHSNPLSDLDTPNAVAVRGPIMAVGGGELRSDLLQNFNWLLLRYKFLYDARLSGSVARPGDEFTVVLSVTNMGDAVMKGTGATLAVQSGASLVSPVSGPAGPVDLSSGSGNFFTWTFIAQAPGTVSFLAGVSGTEFGTGTTAYESSATGITISERPATTLWLDGPGAALDRNIFRPSQGERLLVRVYPKKAGEVTAKVYSASGRLVRTLPKDRGLIGGGQFVLAWDGETDGGARVQRGVYLVAVEGGGVKKVLKVVVR